MSDKNEVGYWIKRKGNTKLEDTAPEQAFAKFAKWLGYIVTKGEPVWVEGWRLRPDFDMKLGRLVEIVILIDGRYHWTDIQARKDEWRDRLYAKAGKKVIHIDAPLVMHKEYVEYLRQKFLDSILSPEQIIYIRQ